MNEQHTYTAHFEEICAGHKDSLAAASYEELYLLITINQQSIESFKL